METAAPRSFRGTVRPLLITILIIGVGILYWVLFVFGVLQRCLPPSEFWLQPNRFPIFWIFSVVFGLLFFWTLAEFVATPRPGPGGKSVLIVNFIALLIIGYSIFHLRLFIQDYDLALAEPDGWTLGQPDAGFLPNSCREAKPFWGSWKVVEVPGKDDLLVKGAVLELHRDRSFVLTNPRAKDKMKGRWNYGLAYMQSLDLIFHDEWQPWLWEVKFVGNSMMLRPIDFRTGEVGHYETRLLRDDQ